MKRVLALIFTSGAGISLALMLLLPAGAATGGTISLGTVSTNTVQVNTSAAIDGWSGYNIHIGTAVSAGVVLSTIGGANGTVLTGSAFCAPSIPAAGEVLLGCVGLSAQAITAAGLLATFTFNATGNGCIVVRLVTVPGDALNDTYTIDAILGTPQTNIVSTATANVLIGTGTLANCGGGPAPTNTPTNTSVPPTNTPTNTPVPATNTPTRTPTNTPVTATRTPTNTSLPGVPTNTPTPTATGTPTNIPSPVPTSTNTPVAGGPTNTPTNTPVTSPGGCPDFHDDGTVTDDDVMSAGGAFGKHEGDVGYSPRYDRDGDHVVTVLDMTSIEKHKGEHCHNSDGDGVSDEDDAMLSQDPHNADSSGDGYTDGEKAALGKSLTFCKVMKADVDHDHQVTILDLASTASVFHKSAGDPKFKPASDFDHDGVITILDVAYQGSVFNKNISQCP